MFLINPQNEYPRHIGDLQIEHPDWQLGDELPAGWRVVADGVFPEIPQGSKVVELAPALVDGVLTRQFEIVAYTAEELRDIELMKIRRKITNGESITSAEAKLLVG